MVIGTFVLGLALANGFLPVGPVAVVGHGGELGLLLGVSRVAEVIGALPPARLPIRRLALTVVPAWALPRKSASRRERSPTPVRSPIPRPRPLGTVTSTSVAAALLVATGLASGLTDIPLIALVQQRVPDHHLAKAPGLGEARVAGAVAVSPFGAPIANSLIGTEDASCSPVPPSSPRPRTTAALILARVTAKQPEHPSPAPLTRAPAKGRSPTTAPREVNGRTYGRAGTGARTEGPEHDRTRPVTPPCGTAAYGPGAVLQYVKDSEDPWDITRRLLD
ncbi:hypothetical protein ACFU53_11540, partial [Streptomyces sp. NPDC057474]